MITSHTPLVSVIVPTFNRAKLIGEAIESVIGQEYSRWELLVVDDGSTDDTASVLATYASEPRVRCLTQPNRGQAAARNHALRHSTGELVAFLDSDNRWLPHKLRVQVEFLASHPEVDVLYGENEEINLNGDVLPTRSSMARHSGEVWRPLLADNFVNFNTSIVRAQKLKAAGGFNESIWRAADYDLWLRLSTTSQFHFLAGVVTQYRVEGERMSNNISARMKSNMASIERFIAGNPGLLSSSEARAVRARVRSRFARSFAGRGQYTEAYRNSFGAISLSPLDPKHWRTLAAVTLRRLGRKT